MTRATTASLVAVGLLSVACGSIAPVKIATGDQCARCRRTIQDRQLAGEVVYSGGLVEKFRAPLCMAKSLTTDPDAAGTAYVTDYTSGKFIKASAAAYVPVLLNRDTGETDYRAYQHRTDADAFARELHATVVSWDAVLEKARS
jgi:hypothetical protein